MNYNPYNRKDEQRPVEYQQFFPGFSPGPPGQRPQEPPGPPGQRPQGPPGPPRQRPQGPSGPPGQRPQGPPGQGRPGMQPPSAPPNFTPQLPREEQQFLSGPSDFRGPFGGRIIDSRTRPRDFSRCMNRFTYI